MLAGEIFEVSLRCCWWKDQSYLATHLVTRCIVSKPGLPLNPQYKSVKNETKREPTEKCQLSRARVSWLAGDGVMGTRLMWRRPMLDLKFYWTIMSTLSFNPVMSPLYMLPYAVSPRVMWLWHESSENAFLVHSEIGRTRVIHSQNQKGKNRYSENNLLFCFFIFCFILKSEWTNDDKDSFTFFAIAKINTSQKNKCFITFEYSQLVWMFALIDDFDYLFKNELFSTQIFFCCIRT